MSDDFAIPPGWTAAPLKDVAREIVDGSHNPPPKQETGFPMLSARNVGWGTIEFSKFRYIAEDAFEAERKRANVEPDDVLLTIVGSIGRAAVIPKSAEQFALQRSVAMIRPNGLDSRFCMYQLLSDRVQRWLRNAARGSAQQGVYLKTLGTLPMLVAPLPEQRRIVAEIEKQFTRLEAGVAALRRVQANLKRYRAAVLKAACAGRLVATEAEIARTENRRFETGDELLARILTERRQSWQGHGKYKEPIAPAPPNLPLLPDGWAWTTAQQLNLANRPCAYGVLQPGEDIPDGVPFVRVGDIYNGKVDLTNLKRISVQIAGQYPRTKLYGGELAITLVGAIGRTAIIPESLTGGNTARAVGIIPLTSQIDAHWVEIWFRNPTKSAEMDSKSHEVARKTLNLEDVRIASVALPPLTEQTRIVAEVERRLSVVEELETVVSANLQRASRLRQSILQKAFTGELVA